MAVKYLIGTSLDSWTAANFVGGVAPVSTDTVIIPPSAIVDLSSSLDQTGVNLAQLKIQRGCQIDIGADGNSLRLSADEVIHEGRGSLFFNPTALSDKLILDSPNLQDALWLGGSSTLARLDILSGRMVQYGAVTVTALNLASILGNPNSASLYVNAGGTSVITSLLVQNGIVEAVEIVGTLILRNGTCTTRYKTGQVISTIYQTGGYLYYRSGPAPASPAGDADVWVFGGTFDARQLDNNIPIVGNLRKYPGAVILRPDVDGSTFVTGSDIVIGE